MARPKIVALTGSTKFKSHFQKVAAEETLQGNIVLTVHVFRHEPEWATLTEVQTDALDALFEHKISMCDELIVINANGYIGQGTRGDIDKAYAAHKVVRFMEPYQISDFALGDMVLTTMELEEQGHGKA